MFFSTHIFHHLQKIIVTHLRKRLPYKFSENRKIMRSDIRPFRAKRGFIRRQSPPNRLRETGKIYKMNEKNLRK